MTFWEKSAEHRQAFESLGAEGSVRLESWKYWNDSGLSYWGDHLRSKDMVLTYARSVKTEIRKKITGPYAVLTDSSFSPHALSDDGSDNWKESDGFHGKVAEALGATTLRRLDGCGLLRRGWTWWEAHKETNEKTVVFVLNGNDMKEDAGRIQWRLSEYLQDAEQRGIRGIRGIFFSRVQW